MGGGRKRWGWEWSLRASIDSPYLPLPHPPPPTTLRPAVVQGVSGEGRGEETVLAERTGKKNDKWRSEKEYEDLWRKIEEKKKVLDNFRQWHSDSRFITYTDYFTRKKTVRVNPR